MCQFGNESKILEELNLEEKDALIGWRNNYVINSLNNSEKFLKSLNIEYLYPKNKPAQGNPLRNNSEGIYNYIDRDYYNYNNYNYYNNNYNYCNNNYNNYNYNNYNYYYYYYLQIRTKLWGKVFKYLEGYRSEFCYPTHLVILDKDSDWFKDDKTKDFANHFNNLIELVAKEYNCSVIEYSRRDSL